MEDFDGSGFSLTIPALLIEKDTAAILKEAAMDGEYVKLKAELEISKTTDKTVEVSLWYSSTLDLDTSLLRELYDYQHLMQESVVFTPHIMTL